jgi:hypothetical protein
MLLSQTLVDESTRLCFWILPMQAFIPLATTGRFAKALGKSIGKPVFRVIQTREWRHSSMACAHLTWASIKPTLLAVLS